MPKRFHKRGNSIAMDMIEVGDVIGFHLWKEEHKMRVGLVSKIEEVGGMKERHFLNEAGEILNPFPDQVTETVVIALAPYKPTEDEKRKEAKYEEFDHLPSGTTFVTLVGDNVVINTNIGRDTWTEVTLFSDGDKGFEYTYTDPLFESLYDGNDFPKPIDQ